MVGTQRRTAGLRTRFAFSLLAGVLTIAATASVASAEHESPPEPVQPEAQEIGLLFTQNATSGSLRALEGKDSDRYVLTLNNPGRQVIWFQDRPGRQSGHLPIRDFIEAWDGFGFADDPPNAALSVLDGADRQDTAILTLGTPRYKDAKQKLRYPVRAESEATGNLAHFEHAHDPGAVERFGHAALFVDDAAGTVINGCLIQPSTNCSEGDLRGADLRGADLSFANLFRADLRHANLSGADLSHANLSSADLSDANLTGADLSYTNLMGTVLNWVDFTSANLSGATIEWRYGYFTGAIFCNTTDPDGSINNRDC